jgi:GWxTD domain-containing protein
VLVVRITRRAAPVIWSLALSTLALSGLSPPALSDEPSDGATVKLEDLVSSPAFESVISRSFEAILPDSQRVQYSALAEEDRCAYRRRFWLRHDPSPATGANEFLEEHLRRLEFALEKFCPCDPLDWDQRGDIALRFGLPESRSHVFGEFSSIYGGMGFSSEGEIWNYASMEMTVRFVDPNLDGRYQLGFDTKHFTAHGRAKVYTTRNPKKPPDSGPRPKNVEAVFARERAHDMEQKGQKAVEEVPVSYAYAPPAPPIPLYYEVVTARGKNGMADVAVNYQVPRDCLSFERRDGRNAASLAKRVRVMDPSYEVLTTDGRSVTLLCADGSVAEENVLLTDEWRLEARPGEYVIGISVKDTLSGRCGGGRSSVVVPDYWGPGLSMSDIQLARTVTEGTHFRRMAGTVVPHPSHAFRREDRMAVYFELYGLVEDRPGVARFTVTTEVTGRNRGEKKNWFQELFSSDEKLRAVSSEVLATGDVPDTAYWFDLSLENLPQDNYVLVVTVKDVRSKEVVRKETAFTVLED